MEAFFAKLPPTHVALEACGGSHHWGRRLAAMGHTVQLIPPQYVKPFVRRGKNDRNDAEAISEAAARPDMPSVPVKLAEQQAEAIVLSARELLVRQRTQLVNAVRGHAAEFGVIAAKNISQLPALLEAVAAEEAVPEAAKTNAGLFGRPGGPTRWSDCGAGAPDEAATSRSTRLANYWPRCLASARSAR